MSSDNQNNSDATTSDTTNNEKRCGSNSGYSPAMPKHILFPDVSMNSEMLNELIMFLFISCSAIMQFINIYRTAWWLPDSYVHHRVNFDLIDPYVILLIALMTVRRFVYCVLVCLLEKLNAGKSKRIYRQALKYCYGTLILSMLIGCVAKLFMRHSYITLFLLTYPCSIYLVFFGFHIEPFLRSTSWELDGIYLNGMPMHSCCSNPSTIRDEVDQLRNDFNNRVKQVIFTSVLNAYYAGAVPCFFAVSIHYNVLWVLQHIIFVWLAGFFMCTVFLFPSKYCDIMHRSALHLGQWLPIQSANNSPENTNCGASVNTIGFNSTAVVAWSKATTWSLGSVVKHVGETYRSSSTFTVATPGNLSHTRFYKLFFDPSGIYMYLFAIQAGIVLSQLVILYNAVEWHFILSISFVALTNQFSLFKVTRDFLITKRMYASEIAISEKQQHSQ